MFLEVNGLKHLMKALAELADDHGRTPLSIACSCGNLVFVKRLVEQYHVNVDQPTALYAGCTDINERTMGTALHSAVVMGREHTVKYFLVDCEVDLNIRITKITPNLAYEFNGSTALHFAVFSLSGQKRENIIRWLVQYGTNMATLNDNLKYYWEVTSHIPVIKLLIGLGIDNDPSTREIFKTHFNSISEQRLLIFNILEIPKKRSQTDSAEPTTSQISPNIVEFMEELAQILQELAATDSDSTS